MFHFRMRNERMTTFPTNTTKTAKMDDYLFGTDAKISRDELSELEQDNNKEQLGNRNASISSDQILGTHYEIKDPMDIIQKRYQHIDTDKSGLLKFEGGLHDSD